MQRSTGTVPPELRKVKGLGDDALSAEGGISMEKDRQHFFPSIGAMKLLPRPALSLHYRIDRLEVARIGGHGEVNGRSAGAGYIRGKALVVLYITFTHHPVFHIVAELGKDILQGFAERGRQDREAPPMRHAENEIGDAQIGRGTTAASSRGMSVSPPSREKRVWPGNFRLRNPSNSVASLSFARMETFSSGENSEWFLTGSMRSISHCRLAGS